MKLHPAPDWVIADWHNSERALGIDNFRGRCILLLAFQLLCPGCVQHAIPQIKRAREAFPDSELAVIGLHSVFEHHEAQGRPEVLAAFLHENRITFPVAMDASGDNGMPLTFRAYGMQGTPTLLLYDASGALRMQHFGHVDDMRLGAVVARLIAEISQPVDETSAAT